MKIVSVILARGGSKEVPNKNLELLPFVIHTSNNSKYIQETWVSSDNNKILELAKNHNAKTLLRPPQFATDTSPSEEALKHFIQNVKCDYVVMIQPTSPLLTYGDLNMGIRMLLNSSMGYDSIVSVYKEHWLPRWNLDGFPVDWFTGKRPMRQDIEPKYVENGAFYIMDKHAILNNSRYGKTIGFYEMPFSRSFQVDTEDDMELIKKLMK